MRSLKRTLVTLAYGWITQSRGQRCSESGSRGKMGWGLTHTAVVIASLGLRVPRLESCRLQKVTVERLLEREAKTYMTAWPPANATVLVVNVCRCLPAHASWFWPAEL